MTLVPGTRLGPYEIQSLLGAGGMGEVYKARDTRLDRAVAIKILPPDVTDPDPSTRSGSSRAKPRDDRRARFEREAKAIAGLNHPHICTLHDVGEHDGALFLVMELLDGESLREQLSRARPAVAAIIDTAIPLADALESAHGKGVVHRDIKPENIFITTRGAAKLLDFGIAKLVAEQAAVTSAVTVDRAGTGPVALGTVAYMSPEQARGEPLDARTDLFSLGVVLYEMATGTQPFRGATAGAVLSEILTKAPAAPVRLNPEVPAELERIVNKLLEKDRALRYQSAADLRVDLERLRRALSGATAGRTEQASIVVLPFENLSPDPDNAYFADGLTEEVIANLSKVRALRVISRTSAMQFKGTRKSLPEIAREVSVRHVLEGSVRRAGNNLRITAQLIEADTDGHVWAERYAGTLDDVFDIQEKVARAITDALQVQLSPSEQQRLAERPVSDVHLLDCYQQAHRELFLFSAESFQRALRLLEQGLKTLGEHPLLYRGLAEAHYNAVEAGLESREEGLRRAAEYTRRVVDSDPRLAHALLGKRERVTGSLVTAIRHFEDAVAANPEDVESLFYLSVGYSVHASPAAGAAVANRLINIDPLTSMNLVARAVASWMDADFTGALAVFDELKRREPNLRLNAWWRMMMLAALGRIGEACSAAEALAGDETQDLWAQMATATKHALLQEREPLCALMTGALESYCWNDPDIPTGVAGWFALVDERDRALQWLEHWVDRGSINYPWLAHGDPFLEPLRREPRFQRLLDRIRPEWEAFVPRFEV